MELVARKFKHGSWLAIISQEMLSKAGCSLDEVKGRVMDEKGKIKPITLEFAGIAKKSSAPVPAQEPVAQSV